MAQPTEYENLSYNGPDGSQWGRASSEKLACYGATPVARINVSTNSISTVSSQSTSSGAGVGFGFVSLVEYTNLVTAVSTMQAQMKLMGLLP